MDRAANLEDEVIFSYRRLPHVLPTLVFVAMIFACLYYACSVPDNILDLSSLLYVMAMLGGAACSAHVTSLSARFILAPQQLRLSPEGLSASFLKGGQLLKWQMFEGFKVERNGIFLLRKDEKLLGALFTRLAIELRGIDGDPGDVICYLQKFLPRH